MPASAYRRAWYVSRKSPLESRKTSGSISKTPGMSVVVTRTMLLFVRLSVSHARTGGTGAIQKFQVQGSKFRKRRTSDLETLACLALLTRRRVLGIDDLRRIRVQLPKPINQRLRGRRALVGRLTHRMVPGEGMNTGIRQQRADRGQTGFQRQFRTLAKIEHTLLGISRRRLGMGERPTTVEKGGPKFRRHIQCREISRAEGRHEQNELQIRHPRILDIQRRHGRALSMATGTESTGTMPPPPRRMSRLKMRSVRS